MSEHAGVLISWRFEDKATTGYVQKWSLPVPGDLVDFEDGASDGTGGRWLGGRYRVIARCIEQPERIKPLVEIHLEAVDVRSEEDPA